MRTRIDYVTFEEPKDFLLDWQKKLVENKQKHRITVAWQETGIQKKHSEKNDFRMNEHLLFIHGAGEGGYKADKKLVTSLKIALGKEYDINFPEIRFDESASDFGWTQPIDKGISEIKSDIILVGHSLGASMIVKYLSENSVNKKIAGVFLIASPFWDDNVDWQKGIKLQENFAEKLPKEVPIFFYHCQDDDEVPFSNLDQYKQKITQATFREIKKGGHQLNNDLTLVADDIKSL